MNKPYIIFLLMKKIVYCLYFLLFISCGSAIKTLKVVDTTYPVIEEDGNLLEIIEPYKAEFEAEMSEIVAISEGELLKAKPQSALTHFLADALLEMSRKASEDSIDFCLLNYGGLRLPALPKGNITKGMIYELLPFDNYMVVLDLDVATLNTLFNHVIKKGGWPLSKEVQLTIDTTNLAVTQINLHNTGLNKSQTYKVTMPDYIANGGDNCQMLKGIPQTSLNILMREGIIEYFNLHPDTIIPIEDKRIIYE